MAFKMLGGWLWWMMLGAGIESGDTATSTGTTDTTTTDTTTTDGSATDLTYSTDQSGTVTGGDADTDTDSDTDTDTDTDSDADTDSDTDTDADTDTGSDTGTGGTTTIDETGLSCPECTNASKRVGDPGGSPCDDGCSTGADPGFVWWLLPALLWRRR